MIFFTTIKLSSCGSYVYARWSRRIYIFFSFLSYFYCKVGRIYLKYVTIFVANVECISRNCFGFTVSAFYSFNCMFMFCLLVIWESRFKKHELIWKMAFHILLFKCICFSITGLHFLCMQEVIDESNLLLPARNCLHPTQSSDSIIMILGYCCLLVYFYWYFIIFFYESCYLWSWELFFFLIEISLLQVLKKFFLYT